MSRLNLTPAQRRQLRGQLVAASDVRLYRRTVAVLEFDRGRTAADIATALGVTRQSVHNRVRRYLRAPGPLRDAPRAGRPSRWDAAARALLGALLTLRPTHVGYAAANWTVPLLRDRLHER